MYILKILLSAIGKSKQAELTRGRFDPRAELVSGRVDPLPYGTGYSNKPHNENGVNL